jgi:mannose-6-phosphate isomerase
MWGGRRLQAVLGKALPPEAAIGESWELYDFPPGVVEGAADGWLSSEVAEGPLEGQTLHELLTVMPLRLLGHASPVQTPHGPQFPLLVKFLDARRDLSIQVHPDEAYANRHPGAHVKNEAWTVIEHAPGARLLKGLRPGTTRQAFERAISAGTVEELVGVAPARVGDVHYLPSGTVHALGAGMLVAEVQTPSDTTFRVYDFNRVDPATGARRPLHVRQALEAIDFDGGVETQPAATAGAGDGIVAVAPQFTLSRWSAHEGMRTPLAAGVASVLIILEGGGGIVGEDFSEVPFRKGDTLLIPADLVGQQLDPESDCRWLEVTFPKRR